MNRRQVLACTASLAPSFGGCLSVDGPPGSPGTSPSDGESCRPPESPTTASSLTAGFPRLEIEPDPAPSAHDARFDVAVLDQFTDEAPARLRVSFTNLASEERDFQFGVVVPFDEAWGHHTNRDAKMALFPVDRLRESETELGVFDANEDGAAEPVPGEPRDGCWRADDGFHYAGEPQHPSLGACERVSRTYLTFGHPDNEPCLPAGSYRFENGWKPREHGEWLTWGFEIQLGE